MGEYLSPAVYVEEVSSGSKPIAGVGTSTGAFVGIAEKGPIGKAELVTSWSQYDTKFGGFINGGLLPHTVYQFFNEGGTKCYVVRTCGYADPSDAVGYDAEASTANLNDLTESTAITVTALSEGSWGDKISATVEPATNGRDYFKIVVRKLNAKGEKVAVEAFDNLTYDDVEEIINDNSTYIKVEEVSSSDNPSIWVAKFAQSVVLSGGSESQAATATLSKNDFTASDVVITAKENGEQFNGIVVTLADEGSGKFSIIVSHSDGEEVFTGLSTDNLKINSEYITIPTSTTDSIWVTDFGQSVTLDVSPAYLKDESNAELIELSTRAPYEGEDITVEVEPGNDPGRFHVFVKHKDLPYEEILNLKMDEIPLFDDKDGFESSIIYASLPDTKTHSDYAGKVPRPRKTEEVKPIYQTGNLTGGDDGLDSGNPVNYIGSSAAMTGLHAFDNVDDINLVVITDAKGDTVVMKAGLTYCELRKDCFFIADPPALKAPQEILTHKLKYLKSSYGALYYPWIKVSHPMNPKKTIDMPPSGVAAGIISKTDVKRGVHKAPAGTAEGYVRSAVGLEKVLTKGEHDILNNPGINVIREFPGLGICVWGARTLTDDPEWKYVNVRRLFMFIEESLDEGTQWVVFEPNDPGLWGSVKRNITAFLTLVWRSGALFGNTPDEAFYVKVDEENNPPEVRDAGQLIIEVGVAPVKPAEFVIIRIQQKTLLK